MSKLVFFILCNFCFVGCATNVVACDQNRISDLMANGRYKSAFSELSRCDESKLNAAMLSLKGALIGYWRMGVYNEIQRVNEPIRLFKAAAILGDLDAVHALLTYYRSADPTLKDDASADCLRRSITPDGNAVIKDLVVECLRQSSGNQGIRVIDPKVHN
jgi:hypothetical protein